MRETARGREPAAGCEADVLQHDRPAARSWRRAEVVLKVIEGHDARSALARALAGSRASWERERHQLECTGMEVRIGDGWGGD